MAGLGLVYLLLTFIICFTAVLLIRLAAIGLSSLKSKKQPPPPPPEKTEKKPEKKNEPVYYIVEKKRARKSTYSEPREIQFKK